MLQRPQDGNPAAAWQAFACERHPGLLVARRRLLPRDRALLEQWRTEAERLRPGHPRRLSREAPYVPPRPLAVGVAAHDLIDRAQDWEREHPAEGV